MGERMGEGGSMSGWKGRCLGEWVKEWWAERWSEWSVARGENEEVDENMSV